MAYLLDANVFISAKNLHYGFDFCPAFWDWLIREHQAGKVYSIERVGDELLAGDDDLAEWAKDRGGDFFVPPDATLFSSLAEVSSWGHGARLRPGGGQHVLPGGGLLPGCASARRTTYGRHP